MEVVEVAVVVGAEIAEEAEEAEDEAGSEESTYSNSTPVSLASPGPPNVTLVGLSKR